MTPTDVVGLIGESVNDISDEHVVAVAKVVVLVVDVQLTLTGVVLIIGKGADDGLVGVDDIVVT